MKWEDRAEQGMEHRFKTVIERHWLRKLSLEGSLYMTSKEKKEFLPIKPIRHWVCKDDDVAIAEDQS